MGFSSLALVAGGLLVAAFVVVVAAGLDMTRMLVTTPMLKRRRDLERYRRLIGRQMYATMAVIALLIGAGAILAVGLLGGWTRPHELPATAAAGVPLLVVELWIRYVERRVKAVPVADPALLPEWVQVLQWRENGPFPGE
jgi:hypothetical protein